MYAALSQEFELGNDKPKVEDEGVSALVGIQHRGEMMRLLRSVVHELLEQDERKFHDVDLMLDEYESFLKYFTKEKATGIKEKVRVHEHEIYKGWFKVNNENLV